MQKGGTQHSHLAARTYLNQLPSKVHLYSLNGIPMSDWEEMEYPPNAQSDIEVPAHPAHPLLIASQSNNHERANKNGTHPLTCNVMWTQRLNTGPRALCLYD
jgi:hypothetical protein